MSNGYTCCVDKERLEKSLKVLDNMNNTINQVNLPNSFIELEELIRNINIDHNNCINNYKDNINNGLYETENIRKNINKLSIGVSKTIKEFSEADQFKTSDIEDIFGIFDNKTNVNDLAFNNNLEVAKDIQSFKENMATSIIGVANIETSTVPIGLGIGAAGVTGAVGAVLIDSMNDSKKDSSEDFQELENFDETKTNEEEKELKTNKIEEPSTPYFANRDKTTIDKFYDEEK